MNKIVHIIEYPKRGPLWNLVNGLTCFENHNILETKEKLVSLIDYDKNAHYIFHTTGKSFPMISTLQSFLSERINASVFIHTLPDYIIKKGYPSFTNYISKLQKEYNFVVMAPSKEATMAFNNCNINCVTVNLGIPKINITERENELKKYYGKIITMSSKNTFEYRQAKGIDRFYQLVEMCGVKEQAIVLGNNGGIIDGILNIKIPHEDFLNILKHAKAYVQLSRSESYNITAIEAKQLKVPVVVSNVAGHKDSVREERCRASNLDEAAIILQMAINNDENMKEIIESNYAQSIKNESIEAFRDNIESAIL